MCRDIRALEGAYGENNLIYTCARAYIRKLLDNSKVLRFLNAHYADLVPEFESIATSETL
jgi:hypothetical protein